MPHHPVYRSLVRLYPREFRQGYGEDLVHPKIRAS